MRKSRSAPLTLFSFQDILTSLMGVVFLIVLLLSLQLIHRTVSVSDLSQEEAAKLRESIHQGEAECQELENRIGQLQQQAKLAAQTRHQLQDRREQLQQRCQSLLAENTSKKKHLEDLNHQLKASEKELHQTLQRRRLEELKEQMAKIRAKLEQIKGEEIFIFNPASGEKIPWLVDLAGPSWQVISGETFQPVKTFDHQQPIERISAFAEWARSRNRQREYFVLFVRPGGLWAYDELRRRLEPMGFELGVDLLGDDQKLIFRKGAER